MPLTKICKECKVPKGMKCFYRHATNSDGRMGTCKECKRAYQRELHDLKKGQYVAKKRLRESSEAYRQKRKEWQQRNPERMKEYRRTWQILHPEQDAAARKANAAIQHVRRQQRRLRARLVGLPESAFYQLGNVPALLQLPLVVESDDPQAADLPDTRSPVGNLA